ncbi:MAG: MarR family transcriptional regulator [Acholeplasmatales bacterium]|nr:MarR family transcriptional regulator [Acholeplasmatales bacterium]
MAKKIGKRIKCVSTKIKRVIDNLESIKRLENLSGTNCFIIVYIYNSKTDVYQKDIEKEFGITRSTASNIISLMEKKNIIIREKVDNDARLKKLVLTDLAKELAKDVINDLNQFEKQLTNNISEEELDIFFKVLDCMENNLEKGMIK